MWISSQARQLRREQASEQARESGRHSGTHHQRNPVAHRQEIEIVQRAHIGEVVTHRHHGDSGLEER